MATVQLRIRPLPAHVRTARLVAAAVARRYGVDSALIDEVKLAVGEACLRAVSLHQEHAPDEQVVVELTEAGHEFLVAVLDCGPAGSEQDLASDPRGDLTRVLDWTRGVEGDGDRAIEALPAHLGLAVIAGLVDELTVEREQNRTAVRMRWLLPEVDA